MACAVAINQDVRLASHDDFAEAQNPARHPVAVNVKVHIRPRLVPEARVVIQPKIEINPASVQVKQWG